MPSTITKPETLLECEKCGAKIRVPTRLIAIYDHPHIPKLGRVAYIERDDGYDGWSIRHNGDELLCPFHPGMRYFLTPVAIERVDDGQRGVCRGKIVGHDVREIEYAVNLDALGAGTSADAELAARESAQREGWRVMRTIDVGGDDRLILVLLACRPAPIEERRIKDFLDSGR